MCGNIFGCHSRRELHTSISLLFLPGSSTSALWSIKEEILLLRIRGSLWNIWRQPLINVSLGLPTLLSLQGKKGTNIYWFPYYVQGNRSWYLLLSWPQPREAEATFCCYPQIKKSNLEVMRPCEGGHIVSKWQVHRPEQAGPESPEWGQNHEREEKNEAEPKSQWGQSNRTSPVFTELNAHPRLFTLKDTVTSSWQGYTHYPS